MMLPNLGMSGFELGMEFSTLEPFKQGLKDFNIQQGRDFKWVKNDRVRVRARCKEENCKWEIYCAFHNARHSYQIKTFKREHTCGRVFRNSQEIEAWVIGKVVKKMRKMKHSDIVQYMKRKFGVTLEDCKVWRVITKTKEIVEESEREQYGKLWDHCHELLKWNPGSTVKMEIISQAGSPPVFHRLYICLKGYKDGFKEGYRPLIGLDGSFLKGYYGGQLLSAIGQDANKHI